MQPVHIGAAIMQHMIDNDFRLYADLELQIEKTTLKFYASTQEELTRIRRTVGDICRNSGIPFSVWKKEFSDLLKWWVYTVNAGDLEIIVYGIIENPPTCTVEYIDVPYEVPEMVPTGAMVTKTRKKAVVHCKDE